MAGRALPLSAAPTVAMLRVGRTGDPVDSDDDIDREEAAIPRPAERAVAGGCRSWDRWRGVLSGWLQEAKASAIDLPTREM
jgi:hypothetical protein